MATALVVLWLAQAALATLGCWWFLRLLDRPQPWPEAWPSVLVLVPVRGTRPDLPGFLDALAAQDHPAWRAVFVVEDASDPAYALLAAQRWPVLVAGRAEGRGQKVHNLLAGVAALRSDDAALVTLDADTRPAPDLLRVLLRPVVTGQAPISTGYRWSLHADARLGSRLLARADVAVATLPAHARLTLCWGGATAVSAAALARLDLPSLWRDAVSDDLTLSRAARAAGMAIYAPPAARLPSPVSLRLADAWKFGVRQHRLLRLHAPGRWALAGVLLIVPPLGVLGAAWRGWAALAASVALAAALGWWRDRLRVRVAHRILPTPDAAATARLSRDGAWMRPVAAALHLCAWVGGAFGRHVNWAGRRYRVEHATAENDGRVKPGHGGGKS